MKTLHLPEGNKIAEFIPKSHSIDSVQLEMQMDIMAHSCNEAETGGSPQVLDKPRLQNGCLSPKHNNF